MIKQAYCAGVDAALMKFGIEDTRSSPYTIGYQQPTTSPHGRMGAINQAFQQNADLGEYGQAPGGATSAVNNILEPGLPAAVVGVEPLRHFHQPTDESGGDL